MGSFEGYELLREFIKNPVIGALAVFALAIVLLLITSHFHTINN